MGCARSAPCVALGRRGAPRQAGRAPRCPRAAQEGHLALGHSTCTAGWVGRGDRAASANRRGGRRGAPRRSQHPCCLAPRDRDRSARHGWPNRCVRGPADRTTPDLLDRSLVLSDVSGTPAAEAASSAAHHLRRRALALRRRESLLAGPRSSMAILTLLPLAGPLVTLVIGSSPSEVYRGGGAAVSAAVGVALTLAGWWTSRRLLVRASRPAPLRSGTASPRVALDPAP